MRQKWKRLLCAVMVMLMCITLLPFAANAEETEAGTNEIKDYVLLLDCSGTMNRFDPHGLCAAACKQFMDQVPLENARISIIAFGYPGGDAYQMEVDKNKELLKYVHLVTPLQETSTVKNTKGIKETIDEVTDVSGGITPIGIAMLAAVDHLEKSGSTDKNAAIILISDGGITTGASTAGYDVEYVDEAIARANKHEWKMFAIQMNDKGAKGDSSTETVRMENIAQQTGVGDFGHVNVKDFSKGSLDINVAIAQIITYMSGNGNVPEPIFMTLPAEETLTVGDLASECNITLLGSNIKTVTLTYPDGSTKTITGNIDEARLITSWEENSRNIKIIVPEAGEYKIKAEGENSGEQTAILFNYLVMDPSLKLLSNPVMEEGMILNKDQSITFTAHFTYHGIDILNNQYYTQHGAELRVISSAGTTKTFPMEATPDGYTYKLPMSEAGDGGAYTAQVWIADSRFTGGGEYSNEIKFKTENLLPTIVDPALPDLEGYVNQSFDTIDLNNYLNNPDNDTLDYRLSCVSDRNVTFDYSIENDYLNIACGMQLGTYEMELSFKDAEMDEYLVFNTFKLNVVERPMIANKIPNATIWSDYKAWYEDVEPPMSVTVNLDEYITDPDGLTVTYTVTGTDPEGILVTKLEGSVLTVSAVEGTEGDAKVTLTANDQMSDIEFSFKLEVISGVAAAKAALVRWIIYALIVIAAIIIIIIIIKKLTFVKGRWSTTFKLSTEMVEYSVDPILIKSLRCARAKKFPLSKLLEAILNFDPSSPAAMKFGPVLPLFLGNGFNNIQVSGVLTGIGFKLSGIPERPGLEITCGGKRVMKKGKINREVTIKLTNDVGTVLTITMKPGR